MEEKQAEREEIVLHQGWGATLLMMFYCCATTLYVRFLLHLFSRKRPRF